MARKGIDHEFQSAAARLADRLANATAAVPDDLRRAVVVTPDERKVIGAETVAMIAVERMANLFRACARTA